MHLSALCTHALFCTLLALWLLVPLHSHVSTVICTLKYSLHTQELTSSSTPLHTLHLHRNLKYNL